MSTFEVELINRLRNLLAAAEAEVDGLRARLAAVAGEDREFGVSCPWNCSGDNTGGGHADDCPWRRARAAADTPKETG